MLILVMLSCLFLAALWSPAIVALLCVVFSCICCHFPIWCFGLGTEWYLIVSSPGNLHFSLLYGYETLIKLSLFHQSALI